MEVWWALSGRIREVARVLRWGVWSLGLLAQVIYLLNILLKIKPLIP